MEDMLRLSRPELEVEQLLRLLLRQTETTALLVLVCFRASYY